MNKDRDSGWDPGWPGDPHLLFGMLIGLNKGIFRSLYFWIIVFCRLKLISLLWININLNHYEANHLLPSAIACRPTVARFLTRLKKAIVRVLGTCTYCAYAYGNIMWNFILMSLIFCKSFLAKMKFPEDAWMPLLLYRTQSKRLWSDRIRLPFFETLWSSRRPIYNSYDRRAWNKYVI